MKCLAPYTVPLSPSLRAGSGLSLDCLWTVLGLSLDCLWNVSFCLWTAFGLSLTVSDLTKNWVKQALQALTRLNRLEQA